MLVPIYLTLLYNTTSLNFRNDKILKKILFNIIELIIVNILVKIVILRFDLFI